MKEVVRDLVAGRAKETPYQTTIDVHSDVKADLDKIKIKGDSYNTTLRMLINVFHDHSLKEIYNKRAITETYYDRALSQRRLNKVGYFDHPSEMKDVEDTGTRAYGNGKYVNVSKRPPYPRFNIRNADNLHQSNKRYINRITLTFDDYHLESIAHLMFLTGLSKPQQVLLDCLKFTYMAYSQDRLVRNSNAELAEANLNTMIANSTVEIEPIVPIYGHYIPKINRQIYTDLKEEYDVSNIQSLLRLFVMEKYRELEKKKKSEEEKT